MTSMHDAAAGSAVQRADGCLMAAHLAAEESRGIPVTTYPAGSAGWQVSAWCAHCQAAVERARLGGDVLVLVTHQPGCQELAAIKALQVSALNSRDGGAWRLGAAVPHPDWRQDQ